MGRSDLAGGEARPGAFGYLWCPMRSVDDTLHTSVFLSEVQ